MSLTVLLNTCSDCSYVRQEVINHLSPCCTGVESVRSFTAFGSSRPVASQIHGIYNVDHFSAITPYVTINVIEIEQMCAPKVLPLTGTSSHYKTTSIADS